MCHNRNDSSLFENQTRQVLFMVPFPEGFMLAFKCKLQKLIAN